MMHAGSIASAISLKLLIVAVFISCPIASSAHAQEAAEPIPPFPEMPYSADVKDKESGEALGLGNWAFDISLTNPNNKAITCRNTSVLTYLDVWGEQCDSRDYGIYLDIGGTEDVLEIPANRTLSFPETGFAKRIEKGTAVQKTLEFCGRDAWDLDCGFNCSDERRYGDVWQQTVLGGGGSIQYRCMKNGRDQAQRETLKCDMGYTPNVLTSECEVQCDESRFVRDPSTNTCKPRNCGRYAHDDIWSDPAPNGSSVFQCKNGSPVYLRTECLNDVDYQLTGNACVKKARTERFRYGNPLIATQCAVSSHNVPGQNAFHPYWSSWDYCRDGAFLSYGPYLRFAFPGRYRVTFHVQVSAGTSDPQAPIMSVDATTQAGVRVLASRMINFSDLQEFRSEGPSRGVSYLLGDNFADSNIEILPQLPSFTGGQRFKMIQLEFEVAEPMDLFEARVQARQGQPNLAGIDIEYFPY